MPICHTCQQPFPDYRELALHIIANKATHRIGRRWASKYLTNQRALDKKVTMKGRERSPLTQQDIENKRDTRRELSGKDIISETICPKCKHNTVRSFPIEYAKSPTAWRRDNRLVKLCVGCGGVE